MRFALFLLAPLCLLRATPVIATGNPLIDPAQFRVTTFATGLSFPTSMALLPDRSFLIGATIQSNPALPSGYESFGAGSGQLLRFTDTNADGVADGPGTVVANLTGAVTSVRTIGDIVVVTTSGDGVDPGSKDLSIVFLRQGASPTDTYTSLGQLRLNFADPSVPSSSIALALRPTSGQPANFDVFFTLAGGDHLGNQIGTVTLSGLLNGSIDPGSVTRFTVTPAIGSVTLSSPARVASGVRTSAGIVFDINGDLLLTDNGFEGVADELHILTAGSLGGSTFLGYPDNYPEYITNNFIGGAGQQAFTAFQPLGGHESRGIAEISLAPTTFPSPLQNGYFVGFHGIWEEVGTANTANPVYFVDRASGAYFPLLESAQAGLSKPDGLLGVEEGLFVLDMFTQRDFVPGTGAVYLITFVPSVSEVPEPATLALLAAGLFAATFSGRYRGRS